MKKIANRFRRANKEAIRHARKLGYKGLSDLDKNGSLAHKKEVKDVFEQSK
jgi:hypothetical protein